MGFLRRLLGRGEAGSEAPIYRDLRERMLRLEPAEIGVRASNELPRVAAAIMDWPVGAGMSSLVSWADGSTSLYLSSGGGFIGGGGQPSVAAASRRLLATIEQQLDLFPPATSAPLPPIGHVALVVRTFDGLRRLDVDERELATGRHAALASFSAAQDVITEIHLVDGMGEAPG